MHRKGKKDSEYQLIKDPEQISKMFEVLFVFIRQLMDIPASDQELCRHYFRPFFVKKGTILESAGSIPKYHNFIVSGYMRSFQYAKDGKEVTTDLNDGAGFSLLNLLGVRFPLKMIPILMLQLLYKSAWIIGTYWPASSAGTIDADIQEFLWICIAGIVLNVLIIPWGYVYREYVKNFFRFSAFS